MTRAEWHRDSPFVANACAAAVDAAVSAARDAFIRWGATTEVKAVHL